MSKIIHFPEENEITIKDVVDSMTDLQREVMYGIIGKVWTAEPNAPVFIHHFAKLGYIALNITHENFLAIQQLRSDILNSYNAGKLSDSEKRTIYRASTIIMDYLLYDDGSQGELDMEKAKVPMSEATLIVGLTLKQAKMRLGIKS